MSRRFLTSSHPNRSRKGFTLMEVLLSSAILLVVLVLLLGMVEGASRIWRNGEHRHEKVREIRAGFQDIAEDLYSAVLTTNHSSLLIEPDDAGGKESGSCKRLFFLVSHAEDRRHSGIKGDLCAVGYFIAVNPAGDGTRNFYRFHVAGDQVAEAVEKGKLEDLYNLASPTNTATTELLARNVIGFEVHALPEKSLPPEALEISLSALNGDTERLLASSPGATARNAPLQQKNLQRYTTTIHLPPLRETSPGS